MTYNVCEKYHLAYTIVKLTLFLKHSDVLHSYNILTAFQLFFEFHLFCHQIYRGLHLFRELVIWL